MQTSAPPAPSKTWQQVLRTVPDGVFDVIGFSMGGYVAREIARIAPDRVQQLVLMATSSRGDTTLQARRKADAVLAAPQTLRGQQALHPPIPGARAGR
jgi:pimeloyl-ACP methyl ester carboxylesterase